MDQAVDYSSGIFLFAEEDAFLPLQVFKFLAVVADNKAAGPAAQHVFIVA
jgi:hypothetical protein